MYSMSHRFEEILLKNGCFRSPLRCICCVTIWQRGTSSTPELCGWPSCSPSPQGRDRVRLGAHPARAQWGWGHRCLTTCAAAAELLPEYDGLVSHLEVITSLSPWKMLLRSVLDPGTSSPRGCCVWTVVSMSKLSDEGELRYPPHASWDNPCLAKATKNCI